MSNNSVNKSDNTTATSEHPPPAVVQSREPSPVPATVVAVVEDHLRSDPDVSAGAFETYRQLVLAGTPQGEPWINLDVLAQSRDATVTSVEEWCSELEFSGVIVSRWGEAGRTSVRLAGRDELRDHLVWI